MYNIYIVHKIHHQLIAIEPANYYTAGDSRTRGNHRLRQIRAKKDTYQHSFFPRSIREWNQVPSSEVCYTAWGVVLEAVIGKANCPPLYLLYVSCDVSLVWVPYWGSILQNRSCILSRVPGKRQFHQTSYTLHGHTLDVVDSGKYLGVSELPAFVLALCLLWW
jgi:hypothetical protein